MNAELNFFLLGIGLAIPLSVVGNLLTPRLQQRWDERNAQVSAHRKLEVEKEYQLVKGWHDDASRFHTYLLTAILRVVYYSLAATLFLLCDAAMFWTILNFSSPFGAVVWILVGVMYLVFGYFAIMVGRTVSQALRNARKIQHFAEFESEVGEKLGEEWLNKGREAKSDS